MTVAEEIQLKLDELKFDLYRSHTDQISKILKENFPKYKTYVQYIPIYNSDSTPINGRIQLIFIVDSRKYIFEIYENQWRITE